MNSVIKLQICLFLMGLILCSPFSGAGQSGSIELSGRIDPALLSSFQTRTLMVRTGDAALSLNNQEREVRIKLDDQDSFKLQLDAPQEFMYVSFWLIDGRNVAHYGAPQQLHSAFGRQMVRWYLFQPGDSVRMFIRENGDIGFLGRGSDKLICQSMLFSIEGSSGAVLSRGSALQNQHRYDEALALDHQFLQGKLELSLAILETYRGVFSPKLYERILLATIARWRYAQVVELYKVALRVSSDSTIVDRAVVPRYFGQLERPAAGDLSALSSPNYMEYLFEWEWNAYKLTSKDVYRGESFRDTFERICSRYQGSLRDGLLLIAVKKLNKHFNTEIASMLDTVKAALVGKQAVAAIQEFSRRQMAAFPFELQDAGGKVHRLSDYRGKVVVVDFWFTGCGACIYLNAAMHSIIGRYKGNSDVVFLSVCQDKSKSVWLKSIAEGQYTSKGQVNLYTNGLGVSHPIIGYYNFMGAPVMLIIDRKGNLVSSAPPRPSAGIEGRFKAGPGGLMLADDELTLNNPPARAFMELINGALLAM